MLIARLAPRELWELVRVRVAVLSRNLLPQTLFTTMTIVSDATFLAAVNSFIFCALQACDLGRYLRHAIINCFLAELFDLVATTMFNTQPPSPSCTPVAPWKSTLAAAMSIAKSNCITSKACTGMTVLHKLAKLRHDTILVTCQFGAQPA